MWSLSSVKSSPGEAAVLSVLANAAGCTFVSLLESQHLLENQVAHKAMLGGLWSRCSVENKMFKKD